MMRAFPTARAVVLGAATMGAAIGWGLGLPGVVGLEGWFYPVRWRGLDPSPFAFWLALPLPLLLVLVLRATAARRHAIALATVIAFNLTAQGASLLLVGPRLETVVERLTSGHGAFLVAAHQRRGHTLDTIRAYRTESETGALGAFAPSKPPGTFAFYAALVTLAEQPLVRRTLDPLASLLGRTAALRPIAHAAACAAVAFPLLTALVVVPLVTLGRVVGGSARIGYAAALIWSSCPSVLVITHHTDGSLYPFLAVSACALAGLGTLRDAIALSFTAGLVLALAIWSSFGLLPAIAFAFGAPLAVAVRTRRILGGHAIAKRSAGHLFALGVGLLLGLGAFFVFRLFPDPIGAYRTAMAYHWRWKLGFVGGRWGLTGGVEFWAYAGLPLLASFALACGRAVCELKSGAGRALALSSLGVLGVHLVVMLYAGCSESARLWLFEVPFIALVAATDLVRLPGRRNGMIVAGLAVAQLSLVPVVRAAQVW